MTKLNNQYLKLHALILFNFNLFSLAVVAVAAAESEEEKSIYFNYLKS